LKPVTKWLGFLMIFCVKFFFQNIIISFFWD
jgi:hypothetical protein